MMWSPPKNEIHRPCTTGATSAAGILLIPCVQISGFSYRRVIRSITASRLMYSSIFRPPVPCFDCFFFAGQPRYFHLLCVEAITSPISPTTGSPAKVCSIVGIVHMDNGCNSTALRAAFQFSHPSSPPVPSPPPRGSEKNPSQCPNPIALSQTTGMSSPGQPKCEGWYIRL